MDCEAVAPSRDYAAFGLRVRSPVPLPYRPLAESAGEPDVTIRWGTTPPSLDNPVGTNPKGIWQTAPGVMLFRMPASANFLVTNGNAILVQPQAGSEQEIGSALVGSPFGALLQQRGLAPFHASSVAAEGGAVIFMGASGAGKSTTLAALAERGYAMVADDVTCVMLDDGLPVALPAFPSMRLCADAINGLGLHERPGVHPTAGLKYAAPAPRFQEEPLRVRHIFALDPADDCSRVELETVSLADAFGWLQRGSYRRRFLRGLSQEAVHFRITAAMASQVPLTVARRPRGGPLAILDELVDRIQARVGTAAAAAAG